MRLCVRGGFSRGVVGKCLNGEGGGGSEAGICSLNIAMLRELQESSEAGREATEALLTPLKDTLLKRFYMFVTRRRTRTRWF